MKFGCTQCGACCRNIRLIHPDWPVKPDGSCIHLQADNRCAVYENRPKECRVGEGRPALLFSEAEWFDANADVCNKLQEDEGLDKSFRVQKTGLDTGSEGA